MTVIFTNVRLESQQPLDAERPGVCLLFRPGAYPRASISFKIELTAETRHALRRMFAPRYEALRWQAKRKGRPGWKRGAR